MNRAIVAVACSAAFLAACERPMPSRFDADVIADSLETPWSMAFASDGRLFVTERVGRIRIVRGGVLERDPWAVISVHESARQSIETGLMGLALDPRFADTHRLYVCYTHDDRGSLFNRIAAFTEHQGKGTQLEVLLDSIPAAPYHNGCRLAFGPDGKLYATTGDADAMGRDRFQAAQSTTSLAGKVLRLNVDGSIPADNPFPHSPIWSLGHRNPQGIAFQPGNDKPLVTEHGTGPGGNNELNRISRGGNYGWPIVIGISTSSEFVNPILVRPEAWTGPAFVTGNRYPGLHGSLLVASLAGRLLGVAFGPDGRVSTTTVLVDKKWGRLRDVVEGPDGWLYVATSNRDGRGKPRDRDDQILRLRDAHR